MRKQRGFTLIELVIVILILADLALVAIPVFQDLQTNARNAATKKALASIREAILIYRVGEITSGRSDGSGVGIVAGFPTIGQVTDRTCAEYYNPSKPHILEDPNVSPNPWHYVSVDRGAHRTDARAVCVLSAPWAMGVAINQAALDYAWIYNLNNGAFWAATAENDGDVTVDPSEGCGGGTTENCY